MKVETLLWGVAVASLAAVGVALVAQHSFGMLPCPWCILQRVVFVAIALLCIFAASVRAAALRSLPVIIAGVLAVLGAVSAVHQHFVASKAASCSLTVADKIVSALKLDEALPSVFEVKASCADAAVSILGVPFDFWSFGLFALITICSGYLLVRLFKA